MSRNGKMNFRLGVFVLSGAILLVLALYLIGSKQNLFGSRFTLKVRFHSVNGLMRGNNVRFAGIDVGTVSAIEIENDTTVLVTMVLENRIRRFIGRNDIASVGTDGLMGNKLVNINASPLPGINVTDGDVLSSLRPLETEEMVRTLNMTNENILVVTRNLRVITDNISNRNSFWHLLADSSLARNIESTVTDVRSTAYNGKVFSGDLRLIGERLKSGKGIGALLADSNLAGQISISVSNIRAVSDSARKITDDLRTATRSLTSGNGALGVLLRDTVLPLRLNQSVQHFDSAAIDFDRNMRALQYSWPFKKGYRKMNDSRK